MTIFAEQSWEVVIYSDFFVSLRRNEFCDYFRQHDLCCRSYLHFSLSGYSSGSVMILYPDDNHARINLSRHLLGRDCKNGVILSSGDVY